MGRWARFLLLSPTLSQDLKQFFRSVRARFLANQFCHERVLASLAFLFSQKFISEFLCSNFFKISISNQSSEKYFCVLGIQSWFFQDACVDNRVIFHRNVVF